MSLELDPRWNWIDVSTIEEGRGTSFVRGECNHLQVEEVHSVDGVLVAALCLTCDHQWTFPYDPLLR
jgi:hypothetical protein